MKIFGKTSTYGMSRKHCKFSAKSTVNVALAINARSKLHKLMFLTHAIDCNTVEAWLLVKWLVSVRKCNIYIMLWRKCVKVESQESTFSDCYITLCVLTSALTHVSNSANSSLWLVIIQMASLQQPTGGPGSTLSSKPQRILCILTLENCSRKMTYIKHSIKIPITNSSTVAKLDGSSKVGVVQNPLYWADNDSYVPHQNN